MFRKLLKLAAAAILLVLVLLVAGGVYLYFSVTRAVHGEAPATPSVLRYAEEPPAGASPLEEAMRFDFDPARFARPGLEFGPMTRWWWPGADVDQTEIDRELAMFAENGFAGVEIQPFTMGLNPGADSDERARVMSWDGEAFYETLRKTLATAAEHGLIVDLNNGSGWPTGGPQIALEDNFRTLLFRENAVSTGAVSLELEPPDPPLSAYVALAMAGTFGGEPRGVHFQDAAELAAVVAARVVKDERSGRLWSMTDQVALDPASAVDLTANVEGRTLSWTAPEGDWKVISFWSLPDGEPPALLANRDQGFVVDHFAADKVRANYDYLLGSRTGLTPYFGKPLRAIFNDSYEFKAERHFAAGFFEEFQRRRGYDIRPWLPAQMKPGYNNMLAHILYPHAKPDFVFSDEDWRLRYDYDLTLSDLLVSRFLDTSAEWMSRRGLQHRTQAYGMAMDVIAAGGAAHIPETEQLYWGGSEAFLKGVASGAWLHNRPVVTAESVVYMNRAYMSTPRKIKISVDKAFTGGVNQVIYHGTAYRYHTPDFGEIGWFPWSSPHAPFVGFSTDLRESNPFWKFVPKLNEYIARSQYALRSGRPSVDVLLYYPFLGFLMNDEELNPEELLPRGEFVGVESPAAPLTLPFTPGPAEREKSPTQAWLAQVWETINTLEELGVTWAWVNDASLREAAFEGGRWRIRGNEFQALILPHVPFVQAETAQSLRALADAGAPVAIIGEAPGRQPSFRDYEARDRAVAAAFEGMPAERLAGARGLHGWSESIARPIRYAQPYRQMRQIQRAMADGSRLAFLRGKSADWTEIRLEIDPAMRTAAWLNPEDGAMGALSDSAYSLPPYGSVIVYASPGSTKPPAASPKSNEGAIVATLADWDVQLGDWRDVPEMRYAAEGVYRTTVDIPEIEAGARYVLDLGEVSATAEVSVNGAPAGDAIYAPYLVDVTAQLQGGGNAIEVRVTAPALNPLIGRAEQGDAHYKQFEGKQGDLLPAGLMGPVRLKAVSPLD
jgi:hypothetical protein